LEGHLKEADAFLSIVCSGNKIKDLLVILLKLSRSMAAWKHAVCCVHMVLNRNAEMSHNFALTCNVFNFSASNSGLFLFLPFSFPVPCFYCSS